MWILIGLLWSLATLAAYFVVMATIWAWLARKVPIWPPFGSFLCIFFPFFGVVFLLGVVCAERIVGAYGPVPPH